VGRSARSAVQLPTHRAGNRFTARISDIGIVVIRDPDSRIVESNQLEVAAVRDWRLNAPTCASACAVITAFDLAPALRPFPQGRERHTYTTPTHSAISAGRSWPLTSTVHSRVIASPPALGSTEAIFMRMRISLPAGTTPVKRSLLKP
jgi:hypothetical protein